MDTENFYRTEMQNVSGKLETLYTEIAKIKDLESQVHSILVLYQFNQIADLKLKLKKKERENGKGQRVYERTIQQLQNQLLQQKEEYKKAINEMLAEIHTYKNQVDILGLENNRLTAEIRNQGKLI